MKVSFELDPKGVPAAALCGVVGLVALHAAFPGLFDYWPKSSSDLAAWVQAVGAIAAIGFAGRFLRLQMKDSERLIRLQIAEEHQRVARATRLSDERLLGTCCLAVGEVVRAMASLYRKFNGTHVGNRSPHTGMERVEGLLATIAALLDKPIPEQAIPPLMEAQRVLSYSITAIRLTPATYQPGPQEARAVSALNRLELIRAANAELRAIRLDARE